MEKALRSFAATLLLIAATTAAHAGQIDTGNPMSPPDSPGHMEAPFNVETAGAAAGTLEEIALDIWHFLPSIF